MRKTAFVILLFQLVVAHSTHTTIKTILHEGKPTYQIKVGEFAHESNALQAKFKLSSLTQQPLEIEHQDAEAPYFINIGPMSDEKTAKDLQQQLDVALLTPTVNAPSQIDQAVDHSNKPERKLWNLVNADIRNVINEVSRVTGKNFLIDPHVQGQISIVSNTPISNKELYQVFLSMLEVSGYAAIPNGDIIKIIPNQDARSLSPDLLNQLRHPPQGEDILVEVIPVHYVSSDQLVPILRPLMPQWSFISSFSSSNMLILSGRANNIRQMANIIKQVDTSSSNDIDMIRLKHTLAMDIANTLKDLMKTQPGSQPIRIAADDRSNSLLISGNKTERIKLRLLIAKLDQQANNANDSNTRVVYLNYLRAEDLVPILAGIAQANFSGNVGTTIGSVTRPTLDSTNPAESVVHEPSPNPVQMVNPAATPNTASASTQNEGTTKPTVQIIAEPNTNSIIINAPASLIRILKTVISQLDIRPAQLLIEALVAEVDENDVNSLGIEWGTKDKNGDFRPGFAIINSKTSISEFQAQIYALAKLRRANILSTPSVVVLDNRQAKILVGKQVSVASTSYPNNASGQTTASPYVTFNRVNVALHLYVRPQITRDQGIQLQIDQGNDTLDPISAVNSDNPIFKISSIVTSVQVESGDIVVLGGLTQDALGNDLKKIPILGDLPGIGHLFQHNTNNREKRVLMVFIKPIILKSKNDAVQVTGGKYNSIRQYELDWVRSQRYDKANNNIVLPPLNQASLPKPFSHPTQQLNTHGYEK